MLPEGVEAPSQPPGDSARERVHSSLEASPEAGPEQQPEPQLEQPLERQPEREAPAAVLSAGQHALLLAALEEMRAAQTNFHTVLVRVRVRVRVRV